MTGTVRWRESILFMAQAGVTIFYEIGAGKVLTGLIKRIADAATASAIGTPDDVARFNCRARLSYFWLEGQEISMFELTGKTALVTGATGTIGGSIARTLHASGRDGRHFRERGGRCSISSRPNSASASMCCRAISPTRPKPKLWCRAPRRRWASSIFSSPMPA